MFKKYIFFILIIFTLTICLCGCAEADFDNLTIIASNQFEIPEGEYTLDYTIKDLKKYQDKYDLILSVKVFDDNNKYVEVSNNRTFKVESDNIYYVTVYVRTMVKGEEKSISKSFTISAIKTNPKLIFKLVVLESVHEHRTFELERGSNFNINDAPEIPDSYPYSEGYSYTILDKYWYIINKDGEEEKLNQAHLTNITKNLNVYAHFEYKISAKQCTITFNSMGGTEIQPITQPYNSSLKRPSDPLLDGYVFCGWYTDSEYKNIFPWHATSSLMKSNVTLYAKYLQKNQSESTDNFDFELQIDTATGYNFYKLIKKHSATLSGNIVLPNGYNNAPISIIDDYAFADQTEIISITIPENITVIGTGAFINCSSLSNIVFENPCKIQKFNIKLFENCISLEQIAVPDSVKIFATNTFLNCETLSTVFFSENSLIEDIPKELFEKTAVTSISLPNIMKNKITTLKNKNGEEIIITYYPPKSE